MSSTVQPIPTYFREELLDEALAFALQAQELPYVLPLPKEWPDEGRARPPRVAAWLPGHCWFQRIALPFAGMRAWGWDVQARFAGASTRQELNALIDWCDVLVWQRERVDTVEEAVWFMDYLHSRGKSFVVELDDALVLEDNLPGMGALIRHADLVTVTTETLAQQLRILNPKIAILPNSAYLPMGRLPESWTRLTERPVVGVQGGSSHRPDWELILPIWEEVARRHPEVMFMVAGYQPSIFRQFRDRLIRKQLVPVNRYLPLIAQMDVHCCILKDAPFTRAKSNQKWIDATLVRRPTVCSPTVYEETVVHDVTGLICHTNDEWVEAICTLLERPEERERLVDNAYHEMEAHYDIRKTAVLWHQAYTPLVGRWHQPAGTTLIDKPKMRWDVITYLLKARGFERYLEIGCANDATFKRVDAPVKVGVDPFSGGTIRTDSDEFFATNAETFDLIFLDGDHHLEQLAKDVMNAAHFLRPGGVICMHDTRPPNEAAQTDEPSDVEWCGSAWKVAATLGEHRWPVMTVDFNYGVSILQPGPSAPPEVLVRLARKLTWKDYHERGRDLLNVLSWNEFVVEVGSVGQEHTAMSGP